MTTVYPVCVISVVYTPLSVNMTFFILKRQRVILLFHSKFTLTITNELVCKSYVSRWRRSSKQGHFFFYRITVYRERPFGKFRTINYKSTANERLVPVGTIDGIIILRWANIIFFSSDEHTTGSLVHGH